MDAITEVQRRIGIAKKNYVKLAKKTNFSLDKCTICRYLEGIFGICIHLLVVIDDFFLLFH